jgi:aminopeptidase-like protein
LLNISRHGHVKSLTGPYERYDLVTIKGHLQSIVEENPLLIPFYVSLAKETIGVALKKKSITKTEAVELKKVLDKFNKSEILNKK